MMIKDIPESVPGNTMSSELKMVIEKVVREHSTGLEEEIPKADIEAEVVEMENSEAHIVVVQMVTIVSEDK
jgi:hypothetical protein